MNLSKQQILAEMGLTPLWELRHKTPVRPNAPDDVQAVPVPLSSSSALAASAAPCSAAPAEQGAAVQISPVQGPAVAFSDAPKAGGGPQPAPVLDSSWEPLATSVTACRACRLCEQRRQAVFGVGDRAASWLFIGEGPGADEDAQGEPFVGVAGQLLDSMLAALDLSRRADVYIANAVKCRPPGNRTPEASEIAACRPYLERQIALLQPKIIVLLGRAAVHAVLGKDDTLSSLRGKTFVYRVGEHDIPVVVTYHPAYLLRTLSDKAKAWEDLCRARALMRAAKQEVALAI